MATFSQVFAAVAGGKSCQKVVLEGGVSSARARIVNLEETFCKAIPVEDWTSGWPSVGPVIPSYTTVYYVGGSSMSIVVPGTLTSSLISNIGSIQSIYGGTDCTMISDQTFSNCSNLTTASFPACTTLDSWAFANCASLTTASFPACTTIGSQVFAACENLISITLPDTIIHIGARAFFTQCNMYIYTTNENVASLVCQAGGTRSTTFATVYLNNTFYSSFKTHGFIPG